ncbi:hypothetical protein Tco_1241210, partial [Tanacetum coccineum]
MHKVRGDGVAGIKRRRDDLYGDGVKNLSTASGRGRLKEDLESSMWRWRQDFKATYGYYKNHKKRAKTEQKQTRERKEYTRDGKVLIKVCYKLVDI